MLIMIWDFIQNQMLGMKWLNRMIGSLVEAVYHSDCRFCNEFYYWRLAYGCDLYACYPNGHTGD